MRVLLVEDHPELRCWLAKSLRQAGYAVDEVDRGELAECCLQTTPYDGVLLDLSLPDTDGLDLLQRVRARGSRVPVLIFTARGAVDERIRGLNAGADDYLPKPFELRELEARLKAVLRRANQQPPVVRLGQLVFDTVHRQPLVGDVPLPLTPRELAVLEALLRRVGRPIARDRLFETVFGMEQDVRPEAIEIYVSRLRKKLEGSGTIITTVRGLGYLITASDEAAA